MDLVPLASTLNALLAGKPLGFVVTLDALGVDEQEQRTFRSPVEDVDSQRLLTARQIAKIWHRPVVAYQLQQAFNEPSRLPQLHAEQNLYRQIRLDVSITVGLLTAALASRQGILAHLGIKPNRCRATALERFVVGWPVPGIVGRWCHSTHATQLSSWIHEMNLQ